MITRISNKFVAFLLNMHLLWQYEHSTIEVVEFPLPNLEIDCWCYWYFGRLTIIVIGEAPESCICLCFRSCFININTWFTLDHGFINKSWSLVAMNRLRINCVDWEVSPGHDEVWLVVVFALLCEEAIKAWIYVLIEDNQNKQM